MLTRAAFSASDAASSVPARRVEDLDTPAALVDVDRMDANLRRAQDFADAHGLKLRPHVKTHKLPAVARRQVELGAIGITCQKLGEAEVMAEGGLDDILISYNLLGRSKLGRLADLASQRRLLLAADSAAVAAGYGAAMEAAGLVGSVLVECDTGAGRAGVQTPAAAVALAKRIAGDRNLAFAGLMTYPPERRVAETDAWLNEAVNLLAADGLACAVVSSGGTPDLWSADRMTSITEYRPGTYAYNDRYHVVHGVATVEDCALRVLTTVVSRPTADRAILDAGSKALSSDLLGLDGYGWIVGYPEAAIVDLNEEHGIVDLSACRDRPALGDRLTIIPNHACVVTNLFDAVFFVAGDRVVERVAVAARGRMG